MGRASVFILQIVFSNRAAVALNTWRKKHEVQELWTMWHLLFLMHIYFNKHDWEITNANRIHINLINYSRQMQSQSAQQQWNSEPFLVYAILNFFFIRKSAQKSKHDRNYPYRTFERIILFVPQNGRGYQLWRIILNQFMKLYASKRPSTKSMKKDSVGNSDLIRLSQFRVSWVNYESTNFFQNAINPIGEY